MEASRRIGAERVSGASDWSGGNIGGVHGDGGEMCGGDGVGGCGASGVGDGGGAAAGAGAGGGDCGRFGREDPDLLIRAFGTPAPASFGTSGFVRKACSACASVALTK